MREREQRPRQSDGNRVRIECSSGPGGGNFHIDQAPCGGASDDGEDASPLSLAPLPLIAAVTRPPAADGGCDV